MRRRHTEIATHVLQATYATYVQSAEDGYGRYPVTPYHNNVHACDVTHSCLVFLEHPLLKGLFTSLEVR